MNTFFVCNFSFGPPLSEIRTYPERDWLVGCEKLILAVENEHDEILGVFGSEKSPTRD